MNSQGLLIGMSGYLKCGKDTVCNIVRKHRPGLARIAFADPLKEELARACGVTVDFINANKDRFRTALQWWGTDFRRHFNGEQYWIEQAQAKLDMARKGNPGGVIFTDVRFPNEYDMVKANGGVVWRIQRRGHDTDGLSHASESLRFPYDTLILNDSGLDVLEKRVLTALQNLRLR